MRIVKEAEERKNEILDAAEELFVSKGFDQTSTNDILEKVGIARGTLYYHFKSKEEILDAMIQRMMDQCMARARKAASDKSKSIPERLPQIIRALNMEDRLGEEMLQQMHKPQNALMHQKMQQQMINGIVPLIAELVEDGIKAGMFQTDYPKETVEMLFVYAGTIFDDLTEQPPEEEMCRMEAFIYNIERLFGVEQGALRDDIMGMFAEE